MDRTLRKKAEKFKAHLTKKFKWDFDAEPDDCAPVVVELPEGALLEWAKSLLQPTISLFPHPSFQTCQFLKNLYLILWNTPRSLQPIPPLMIDMYLGCLATIHICSPGHSFLPHGFPRGSRSCWNREYPCSEMHLGYFSSILMMYIYLVLLQHLLSWSQPGCWMTTENSMWKYLYLRIWSLCFSLTPLELGVAELTCDHYILLRPIPKLEIKELFSDHQGSHLWERN